MAETPGPVEAAYKAWVDSITEALTLRQRATVAQIYALARMLDASPDEPLSAKTSASRELRQVALELRDTSAVGRGTAADDKPAPPPDGVADIQAQRRKRTAS